MPVLKNAKHELFAQALAKGMPAIRAYRVAGYKPHPKGASAAVSASMSKAKLHKLLEDRVNIPALEGLADLFGGTSIRPKEADDRG